MFYNTRNRTVGAIRTSNCPSGRGGEGSAVAVVRRPTGSGSAPHPKQFGKVSPTLGSSKVTKTYTYGKGERRKKKTKKNFIHSWLLYTISKMDRSTGLKRSPYIIFTSAKLSGDFSFTSTSPDWFRYPPPNPNPPLPPRP